MDDERQDLENLSVQLHDILDPPDSVLRVEVGSECVLVERLVAVAALHGVDAAHVVHLVVPLRGGEPLKHLVAGHAAPHALGQLQHVQGPVGRRVRRTAADAVVVVVCFCKESAAVAASASPKEERAIIATGFSSQRWI